MRPHPDLTTERIQLRPLLPGDASALFAYRADPEVSRYQGWSPRTLAEAEEFLARQPRELPDRPGEWVQLGILCVASGQLVGDVGFHALDEDPRQAEVGISLAPSSQGRGLAGEALGALLSLLFAGFGCHRVIGNIDPRNAASLRLFERLGFRQEARHRASYWSRGEWVDEVIYAQLRSEWPGTSSSAD